MNPTLVQLKGSKHILCYKSHNTVIPTLIYKMQSQNRENRKSCDSHCQTKSVTPVTPFDSQTVHKRDEHCQNK